MLRLFFSTLLFFSLHAFDATIPVLHLPDFKREETRKQFLQKLDKAAREVGFFALTDAGVPTATLDEAYEQIKVFFDKNKEEKNRYLGPNGQRGYVAGESPKDSEKFDFKEFYHIGRELPLHKYKKLNLEQNIWPEEVPKFRAALENLYQALDCCRDDLAEMFSLILGQENQFLSEKTGEGNCLMRAIHYPANPPKLAIWAGEHTDINLFTILPRSTAKGLQVCNKNGEWIDVIVPDGAFVINCGDMLENLSNGSFRSSLHRVVAPTQSQERYSVVFFVHPRPLDAIAPLPKFLKETGGKRRYANLCARELLAERLIDLKIASRELMESFVQSGAPEKLREVGRLSEKALKVLEGVYKVRVRRVFGLFWPLFDAKIGGNINFRIWPPIFASKSGSKEAKNRQNLTL